MRLGIGLCSRPSSILGQSVLWNRCRWDRIFSSTSELFHQRSIPPFIHVSLTSCLLLILSSSSFFFLHDFGPSAVHHLPCRPAAVTLMSYPMYSSFSYWPIGQLTSTLRFPNYSSAFQLAFLVQDFLPEFEILLSNFLTTCPAHCCLPTRTYINRLMNTDAI